MEGDILGQVRKNKSCSDLSCAESWVRKKPPLQHERFGLDLQKGFPGSGREQMLPDKEFFPSSGVVGQPPLEPERWVMPGIQPMSSPF